MSTACVLVTLAFLPVADPAAEKVIARIRDAEALYANLDVKYSHSTIQTRPDPVGPPDYALASNVERLHSVLQGGKVRVDADSSGATIDGRDSRSSQQKAFDGSKTRTKAGGHFNINDSRLELVGVFRPHSYAVCPSMFAPLSVWLAGGERLRKHPGAHFGWEKAEVVTTHQGTEEVDGLACVKLVSHCTDLNDPKGPEPLGTVTIWVAPERNYLPIKWSYVDLKRYGKDKRPLPVGLMIEGQSTGLFECQPQLWIPKTMDFVYYDVFANKPGALVVDHKERMEVESVDPNPQYPDEFFRDIQPDPGMVVYEVSNGKITKSYLPGQYSAAAAPAKERFRRWYFAVAAVVLVLAGVLFQRLRRRRKPASGRPEPGSA